MPIKTIVVNASPLISLFRAGLDFILPAIANEILVPDPVWREITDTVHQDEASVGLSKALWATRLAIETIKPIVSAWDLGSGEESVINHVYNHQEYHAVLDDAQARRCAYSLDLSVIGTGGILLIAKKKQVIPSIKQGLSSLKNAGLFIAPVLEQRLLDIAGEKKDI